MFGKFLHVPIKTLLANSLAPIAKPFGVPLSVLGGDVGGKDPKNADEGKEEPNYLKELLEAYTGDQGVLQNFSKLLTVVGGRDMINKGLSVLADWKSRLGFARGGWISGPMSGYPVSLDGGASTSFIGHGTEWVGMKGYAQGGAYVVPFNTPATKMNSGLTSMRMRQAAAGGYALPFSNGGALQTFSEGGKFMTDDQKKAYENGKKHTRHFEVDGAKYAATYTKTANEIVVKGIQKVAKEGGWFGVGQKKPWLSPGGDEYKKIFASEELKYAIAKHAGMRSGPNSRNKHVDPSLITSLINRTIRTISSLPIPRVVIAGVPIRIPLVINGLRSSKGTIFLFTVIPAFSKAFSADFPVTFLFDRSISITCVSVPPEINL